MSSILTRHGGARSTRGVLALAAAFACTTCLAGGSAVGTFTPTGSLPAPTIDIDALMLRDGRALITNGYAVLFYSPASGSFAQASQFLLTPHGYGSSHRDLATLLNDGRVLFAGGGSGTDSAEIFDPATETPTATSSLHEARAYHSMTKLPDGRVLVTGGWIFDQKAMHWVQVDSNEIYDPQSGQFTLTGTMHYPRGEVLAVRLEDGRVLIAGGYSYDDQGHASPVATAELFDPDTGTFSDSGTMLLSGLTPSSGTATRLRDGRVLFVGNFTTTTQIYDPVPGTFSQGDDLQQSRAGHSATLLADGKVLIAGGFVWDANASTFVGHDTSELFDPASGQFTYSGTMQTPRYRHAAILLGGGRVLVAGGTSGEHYPDDFLDGAEIYTADAILIDGFDGH